MELIYLNEEERRKVQAIELKALKELDRICRKNSINYALCGGTLLGAVRHNGFIPWDDDVDVYMMRSDYDRFAEVCRTELSAGYFYQSHETDPDYYHLFNKIRVDGTVFKESFLANRSIHHGVYIDIFPIDYIPDNPVKRAVQYYLFHFYRTGMMAEFLDLNARTGKKKKIMRFFSILYSPFSLDFLYRRATEVARKYSICPGKMANSFCGVAKKKEIFARDVFESTVPGKFEDLIAPVSAKYDTMLTQLYGDYMTPPPPEKRGTRHGLTELVLE